MKITLLHPSRERAEKAKETFDFWMKNRSGEITIEHILSIDNDDSQKEKYMELFKTSHICCNDNTCVVEATNIAAKVSTGDILIYLSDDFKCPENWDKLLDESMVLNYTTLLKVDDCLQKFHIAVVTIPIMNRELYNKLGYFWQPKYKSMFVDEDLYWTCKNNAWMLEVPDLKFPHEHPANGKAPNDETYKRSEKNWDQGKAVFAERKAANFPL